jgi:branched-chain amino acid transport system ATP-binding protein
MLDVKEIDVYHGDLQALSRVSLTIEDKEIVAIVGSNGAGKSTLLRTICGLHRPATGSLSFDGVGLIEQPVHEIVNLGICMVPEERRVFREMSVLENLEMGAVISRARQARDSTMNWVYEVFPILKTRQDQKAGTLSGGEQQMLLIARALMSQPRLLLIDELSLGLAPLLVQNLFKTMRRLHESMKIAIVLVEQNVRAALELADRGYVIEGGRIVAGGEAKELLGRKDIKDAYFGVAPESWAPRTQKAD